MEKKINKGQKKNERITFGKKNLTVEKNVYVLYTNTVYIIFFD